MRTCLEGFLVSVVSVINSFRVTGVSLGFGFPEFLGVSGFIGYWCSRGFTGFLETLSFVKSKKALSYQRSLRNQFNQPGVSAKTSESNKRLKPGTCYITENNHDP